MNNLAGCISLVAKAWADNAESLADWTMARIIVRKDVYGRTHQDGKRTTGHDPISRELLIRHYQGIENVGAHSISSDGFCLCFTADVDAHDDSVDQAVNWQCVNLIVDALARFKLSPVICDSNGKGGFHVRQFFKKPVPSNVVYWLGQAIRDRLKKMALPDCEMFPKQGAVTIHTPYGNWIRLPGKHHKRDHWTRIFRGDDWLDGEAAIRVLIRAAGDDASELLKEFESHQPKQGNHRLGRGTRNGDLPDVDKVNDALRFYRNDSVHYDQWIGVGMALNDWDKRQGLDLWRQWSAQSPKHVEGACERKWPSFSPGGGLTIASIFKEAIDRGWSQKQLDGNGRPQATIGDNGRAETSGIPILGRNGRQVSCQHNSKIWLMSHNPTINIRYDKFRQAIFVNDSILSDELIISLTGQIEESMSAAWCQEHVRSAMVDIAHVNTMSSLTDWLDSLSWDGESRINSFFKDAYGCELDPYTSECGRILFLSGVARAYDPGCQSDVMVVMIGRQGTQKSMGVASLSPFPNWYADDLGCDLFEGRAGEGLQGKWIFEFSEFARINRATLEAVKSFISRRVDHYRPPYGRIARDFPRSCIFIGTTNNQNPLMDLENRRFLPVHCKDGNARWIAKNRENLWAEAVRRYRDGEQWWVTDGELARDCVAHQEAARMDDAWEAILEESLVDREKVTMREAADKLLIKVDRLDRSVQTRIGIVLSAIGFKRKRIRNDGKREYIYERKLEESDPPY